MKDKSPEDRCKPELVIPHKIKGILPVIPQGSIKIDFELPSVFGDKKRLKENLKKEDVNNRHYSISGAEESSNIELKFCDSNVEIVFK